MKNLFAYLALTVLATLCVNVFGQNKLGKTDDVGRIVLNSVMFPQEEPLNKS